MFVFKQKNSDLFHTFIIEGCYQLFCLKIKKVYICRIKLGVKSLVVLL